MEVEVSIVAILTVQKELKERLLEDFESLPTEMQRRVGEFAHALVLTKPQGTPARELLAFAGTMDPESAREIREAIEEGCERVDLDEW